MNDIVDEFLDKELPGELTRSTPKKDDVSWRAEAIRTYRARLNNQQTSTEDIDSVEPKCNSRSSGC